MSAEPKDLFSESSKTTEKKKRKKARSAQVFKPYVQDPKMLLECSRMGNELREGTSKMVLLQFVEDVSDRQMERAMRENMAFRWFCGFHPEDETPDFTYFTKLRKRIGTKGMADLFNSFQAMLKEQGYISESFTFLDASSVISKTNLWKERDKAIAQGEKTLNNQNVGKHSSDGNASVGAKSNLKMSLHVSVNILGIEENS